MEGDDPLYIASGDGALPVVPETSYGLRVGRLIDGRGRARSKCDQSQCDSELHLGLSHSAPPRRVGLLSPRKTGSGWCPEQERRLPGSRIEGWGFDGLNGLIRLDRLLGQISRWKAALGPKCRRRPTSRLVARKVVVKLTSSVLGHFGACFRLNDHLFVHDHVDALYTQLLPFVNDLSPNLPCHAMTARQKLTLQRHHVKVLEKSKSEVVVNLEKRPDHRSGEVFFNQVTARHKKNARRQTTNHQTRRETLIGRP